MPPLSFQCRRNGEMLSRIGFVTTIGCPWGGCEELWSRTALELAGRNVKVAARVRAWPTPPAQYETLKRAGCELSASAPQNRLRRICGIDPYRWLDRVRPDLLVVSQAVTTDGLGWAAACSKRGIPYALLVQCAGEQWWPNDEQRSVSKQAFEKAVAVFFVSEGNLRLVRRQLPSPLPRATVVRNPFNVSFDAAPGWPGGDELRFACVARLDPMAKGQDLILEVLATKKWRDRQISVSFVGEGSHAQGLRELAEMLHLRNVTFCGFVQDIEKIWAEHHALLLPSRYEGLPLAVVEAMLCGRACVVTNVAGNAELIDEGVHGFVAAAPDVDALDEAMERAWQSRHRLQAIGEAAAMKVRQVVPPDPAAAFADILTSYTQD